MWNSEVKVDSECFHCFSVLQRSHWTEGARQPRFCFLPLPHTFGGQIIILRTFMMHNKDLFWANIGMNDLVINALGRSSWHHLARSSSKFGSYCLGDLAYSENLSCPPHPLSKSPPGCCLPWSWYRLLAAMRISLRSSPAISLLNALYSSFMERWNMPLGFHGFPRSWSHGCLPFSED